MAKKTNVGGKVIGGALIAGALGLVAGMLLAPQSGKKTIKAAQKTVQSVSADFYKFIAPRIKKMKRVGDKEYNDAVNQGLAIYAKLRKLSVPQINELKKSAEHYWKTAKKHL